MEEKDFKKGTNTQCLTTIEENESILSKKDRITLQFNDEFTLTEEQDEIIDEILNEATSLFKRSFFLSGLCGTGKTHLFNALISKTRNMGLSVITMASTGFAATLLDGGVTAHRALGLSFYPSDTSLARTTHNIINCQLFIWDEATMIQKGILHEVDRTFRHVMSGINPKAANYPFGGKLILFGGDWRQTLPIGNNQDISASIQSSTLWPTITKLKLATTNMRLQIDEKSERDFWERFLNHVGTGTETGHPSERQTADEFQVVFPDKFLVPGSHLNELIDFVFSDEATLDQECAILTLTNEDCTQINHLVLEKLNGKEVELLGMDEPTIAVPLELIHEVTPSGMPPYKLRLKKEAKVMLLRNLETESGLCSGSLLKVIDIQENVLMVELLTGRMAGSIHYISKMKCRSNATMKPCQFSRYQFPVALAYAITIHKCRGITFDRLGLFLPNHVFCHGQLYGAISRVKHPKNLRVILPNGGNIAKNIVYRKIDLMN